MGNRDYVRPAVLVLVFGVTFAVRVWDIQNHFWLLEDQIRDWRIALRPLGDLPLVGSPTHVHGYTIGPAFYWLLWLIRITFGPWFHNLPHAGGIGQAVLQSLADTMLAAAIWQRTRSVWLALTAIILLATAPLDLSAAALVWNPMAGVALAKMATALVLMQRPLQSSVGIAVTTLLAWSAVHAYTGAIFVAGGIFTAILAGPFVQRDWNEFRRRAVTITVVVALLQVPHAIHQASPQSTDGGMSAVTGSVGQILAGEAQPAFSVSWNGYVHAVNAVLFRPWGRSWMALILIVCCAIVLSRFRRDETILSVVILPQALAIVGFAFYLGDFLDDYYYLSLMPAVVLTLLLSVTALDGRARAIASIALFVLALAMAPPRIQLARLINRMPVYQQLVAGSTTAVRAGRPMRAIQTEFPLPPTSDPTFVYEILGGRIDPSSREIAVIKQDGGVVYEYAQQ